MDLWVAGWGLGCDGLSGSLYGHVCIVTVCKEYRPPRATLAAVLRDLCPVDTTKPGSGCTPPLLSFYSLSSSSLTVFLLGDAISTSSSNASSSWVQQRHPLGIAAAPKVAAVDRSIDELFRRRARNTPRTEGELRMPSNSIIARVDRPYGHSVR